MAKKNLNPEGMVQLFKEAEKPAQQVVAKRTTVSDRKTLMLQALREKDPVKVTELTVTLAGFMQKVLAPLGDSVMLDQPNADHLIEVTLEAHRDIAELAAVVWDEAKRLTFDHLDAVFAAKGEKDPAALNGSIESPHLGYKLCREGAGYTDPTIDEEALVKALGDRWQEVYDVVTIPAQTMNVLNVDTLLELAKAEPALLEKIRPALVSGELKSAKLNLRNINPDD